MEGNQGNETKHAHDAQGGECGTGGQCRPQVLVSEGGPNGEKTPRGSSRFFMVSDASWPKLIRVRCVGLRLPAGPLRSSA